MNAGVLGFPSNHYRRFESEPQGIDTTSGNRFFHGFGRNPACCEIRLVCFTANNGYLVGQEMPLSIFLRSVGANQDGAAPCSIVLDGQGVYVFFIAAANVAILNNVGAPSGSPTYSQWRLKVYALDLFPFA